MKRRKRLTPVLILVAWRGLFLGLLIGMLFSVLGCSSRERTQTTSADIEEPYLKGEWAKAYSRIVPKLERAPAKDKLLLLLQAGTILHTMYQWQGSTKLFEEALALSDTYTKSVTENFRAYFLNDSTKRYVPENFERVLIFYYLACNHIMLDDLPRAYQYFKRMGDELVLIRDFDAAYKENYAVRYLYALVAEVLGRREEARVQYNNILASSQDASLRHLARASLYALAVQEGDISDLVRYRSAKTLLSVYRPPNATEPAVPHEVNALPPLNAIPGAKVTQNSNKSDASDVSEEAESVSTSSTLSSLGDESSSEKSSETWSESGSFKEAYAGLGSVVIIHESGLAPYKVSRGKIGGDKEFELALGGAIGLALLSDNLKAISYGQLFFWVTSSENPIPLFKRRKQARATQAMMLKVDNHAFFTPALRSHHGEVVLQNFNDNYERYVSRHVLSIVTKVATVIVTSAVASSEINKKNDSGLGDLIGLFINFIGGAVIKETLKPDLRSWTLAFDTLQIYRIFFPPGTYTFTFEPAKVRSSKPPISALNEYQVVIEAGETTFLHAYSY